MVGLDDTVLASVFREDSVAGLSPCRNDQQHTDPLETTRGVLPMSRELFVCAQHEDPSLATCFSAVVDQVEARGQVSEYFLEDGLLLRKWASHKGVDESWSSVIQIVVPLAFRSEVFFFSRISTLLPDVNIEPFVLRYLNRDIHNPCF